MSNQKTQKDTDQMEYFKNSLRSCKNLLYKAHDKNKEVKNIKINFILKNSPVENIAKTVISFSRHDITIKEGITDILNCFSIGLYKEPLLKEKYISCTIELN